VLASIAVRAVWLYLSWDLFFHCDERGYLDLAETWARAGTYHGEWAPLHVFFLGSWIEWLGPETGVRMARCALSVASVLTGIALMGIGTAAAGRRVGCVTGWVWALYLPLVPFAHVLLSEGLQMLLLFTCLWLLVVAKQRLGSDGPSKGAGGIDGRVLLAGVLMGGAGLARDASVLWLVAITLWCMHQLSFARGLGFAATALLVIAPWSASISRDIGSFQLLGRTAGVNAYLGWNAHYINFDHGGGLALDPGVPGSSLRSSLTEPPAGVEAWTYEFDPSAAARQRGAIAQGLRFIAANPGFFLRTRVVKAADLLTPNSYMVRFLRMPRGASEDAAREFTGYRPVMPSTGLRAFLAAIAVVSAVALMLFAVVGVGACAFTAGGSALWLAAWGATLPMIFIVTMSRFRAPLDGLMMVPASAVIVALIDRRSRVASVPDPRRPLRFAATTAALTGLLFLWFLAIPSLDASLRGLP
jgi:hypothetical protein